ncbi:MAG TPA: OsmC family peroxiredoxin [Longimicrobiales bacterium]|nr:OsmC family peroxiredoxin [Longimicrobiales bacterium]
MPVRKANAVWEGSLQDGKGTMAFGSGAFEGAFTYASRFQEGPGTNPEELLAAAHAGCFSMAFSNILSKAGFVPTRVETTARVRIESGQIDLVELETRAQVPGIDEATFNECAEQARTGCPVSKLFGKSAEIRLDAKLVSA